LKANKLKFYLKMTFNNRSLTVSQGCLLLIMIMVVGSVQAIVYENPTHKTYQTYDPRALGEHYPQPQPRPQYGYEKYEETSYHHSEPASHSRPAYLEPPLVSSQRYTAVHTPSYSQPPVYRPPQQHQNYGHQGHALSRYGLIGSAFQQAQRQLQGASLPFGRNGGGGGQQKGFVGSYIASPSAQGQGFGHGAAIYTPARLISPGYRQSYHQASSSGPAAGISTRNGFGYHPSSYPQQRQPLSHQLLAMYTNRELPDGLQQGDHVTASEQLQHRQPQQHQQLHPLPPQEKEYRSNEEVFEASLVDTKSSADYGLWHCI
jgi:hypothetical protein